MRRVGPTFSAVIYGLFFVVVLSGCGGGDGDGGGGGPQPTTSGFNGTFSGDITTTQVGQNEITDTQGEQDSDDTINLSLTVGSPLSGTFFRANRWRKRFCRNLNASSGRLPLACTRPRSVSFAYARFTAASFCPCDAAYHPCRHARYRFGRSR